MTEGLKLKCKRCGHAWIYKGKSEWYTSCPRCKTNINVRKARKGGHVR